MNSDKLVKSHGEARRWLWKKVDIRPAGSALGVQVSDRRETRRSVFGRPSTIYIAFRKSAKKSAMREIGLFTSPSIVIYNHHVSHWYIIRDQSQMEEKNRIIVINHLAKPLLPICIGNDFKSPNPVQKDNFPHPQIRQQI